MPEVPSRILGTGAIAFASINWIIGAGIFAMPALAAAALGPAAVVGYLVCTVLLGLVSLCLAEAGSRVTEAGGPFAYARVPFGPVVGGVIGTMMWLSCLTGSASVANLWADTLAALWPAMAARTPRVTAIVACYAVLACVNVRGARQGSRLSGLLAIAKLLPLVGIVVLGAFYVDPAKLQWTRLPSLTEVGNATVLLFYAYVGIEGGLYASGEVKDPQRTIPRALLLAILIIGALYVGLQLVAQGILGADLPQVSAPLVRIAEALLGPWGARFMIAAILVSTSGYLVADALCSPRAVYALAGCGQLPRFFARLQPRFGTPANAVCVYEAMCAFLAVTGSFRPLAIFTSAATLIVYATCCMGLLRLRRLDIVQGGRPFRAPGGSALPIVTTLVILGFLATLSRQELLATLLPVAVSALAYAAIGWRKPTRPAQGPIT
jgi:APA family basic amino acid/polyamine antiporter